MSERVLKQIMHLLWIISWGFILMMILVMGWRRRETTILDKELGGAFSELSDHTSPVNENRSTVLAREDW